MANRPRMSPKERSALRDSLTEQVAAVADTAGLDPQMAALLQQEAARRVGLQRVGRATREGAQAPKGFDRFVAEVLRRLGIRK